MTGPLETLEAGFFLEHERFVQVVALYVLRGMVRVAVGRQQNLRHMCSVQANKDIDTNSAMPISHQTDST